MKEQDYDRLLHIKTEGGQQGFTRSFHYHRYEATPYSALDILFQDYKLAGTDRLVDFGCGKGRLVFYSHYLFQASGTGVEMNEDLYEEALRNAETYVKKSRKSRGMLQFECSLAEEYRIKPEENCFYFFNPFSIQVFRSIIANILLSMEEHPRSADIVLYYPSEEYIFFLENYTSFELEKEVELPESSHDHNERFLIYKLKV
jgi:SAM-dependent methyltransferase